MVPPPRYRHESPEEGQATKKRRRGDWVPNTAVAVALQHAQTPTIGDKHFRKQMTASGMTLKKVGGGQRGRKKKKKRRFGGRGDPKTSGGRVTTS